MTRLTIALLLGVAACSGGTKSAPTKPVEPTETTTQTTTPVAQAPAAPAQVAHQPAGLRPVIGARAPVAPVSDEPTSGWNCFSVTGVDDDGNPWANSECVRGATHCQEDQASMQGYAGEDSVFVDCAYFDEAHCYTYDMSDPDGDQLCFVNERDCNASVSGLGGDGTCEAKP